MASARVLPSKAWMAACGCRGSDRRRLASPSRAWNLQSSRARVPVTFLAPASKLVTAEFRDATAADRDASPRRALRTYGGVPAKAADSVCKLCASCTVLILPICWLTPPKAWVTSYGDVVLDSGIGVAGSCGALPSGSSPRYLSPSSVLISIPAVDLLPTHSLRTRKVTATLLPSSVTPVTLPTVTPAIRTSLPGCSPAASAKYAV